MSTCGLCRRSTLLGPSRTWIPAKVKTIWFSSYVCRRQAEQTLPRVGSSQGVAIGRKCLIRPCILWRGACKKLATGQRSRRCGVQYRQPTVCWFVVSGCRRVCSESTSCFKTASLICKPFVRTRKETYFRVGLIAVRYLNGNRLSLRNGTFIHT